MRVSEVGKNFETQAIQLVFCIHCKKNPPSMHGWLCRSCWRDPVIKAAYKREVGKPSKIGKKLPTKPASRPCQSQPGTIEKFEELCRRAENGEELWHPLDKMGEE